MRKHSKGILVAILSVFLATSFNVASANTHEPQMTYKIPFLVAASNAPQSVKDIAGYVANGTDDQVEIQAAIDALGSPGRVELSSGTFYTTGAILLNDETVLEGQGWGGATDPAKIDGTTVIAASSGVVAIRATDKESFRVANLKVYGGRVGLNIATTGGAGIHRNFILENLVFNGQSGSDARGLQIIGASPNDLLSTWRANNIIVRRVSGIGINVQNTSDWFGSEWYSFATIGHAIQIRDSASFNANLIRGDNAGTGNVGKVNGIRLLAIANATFTNISAMNNNGEGILFDSSGSDVQFVGGWVRDNGWDSALPEYQRTGMTLSGSLQYITVSGMHFYNTPGLSTQQYGMLDIGPLHTLIGNTFHDNNVSSARAVDSGAIIIGNRGL